MAPELLGLRPVRDADAGPLAALIEACWSEHPGCVLDIDAEEPWLRAPAFFAAAEGKRLWVLDDDTGGSLAASIAVRPVPDDAGPTAELKTLYVARSARRRGLGAALVAWAEGVARRELGARRMILWSDTRFVDAHRLYTRLGYEPGGLRELHDLSNTVERWFGRDLAG
ncbi:MAG: GNAT family N-acetyltransferase [Acidimicrobiales bacterium]